jgi:hypothetical protein
MARHEYALHEIIPVLTFRNEGYSYSRISAVTGIPRSTVIWLIKKHAADHCARLKAPNRRGKYKRLTRCDLSAIFRNVRRDRRKTLDQLSEYGTGDRPLARATVLRLLKKAGYAKRPTTDKPILKPIHYAARLKWAREHKYWSVEDWDRVIWSDESGRHLGKYSTKDKIWRRLDERLDLSVMHGTHVKNRSYVGYWATISKDGVGPIHLLPHNTTMNTGLLQDVLEKHLLPHYNIDDILQRDNSRYHTASSTTNFLREHNVTVLDWPSQSPDLSPIENIWQTLNLAIDKRMPRIHTYQNLEEVIREEWNKIDKKVVLKCIRSMPKRCMEVIRNHGGSIDY